jgi:hypothetical protein
MLHKCFWDMAQYVNSGYTGNGTICESVVSEAWRSQGNLHDHSKAATTSVNNLTKRNTFIYLFINNLSLNGEQY